MSSLFIFQTLGVLLLVGGWLAYRKGLLDRFRNLHMAGFEEKLVSLGSEQMWYLEKGESSSTVVLLHGFGGEKEAWIEVASRLVEKRYHVLLPDLPGFGSNPKDAATGYDPTAMTKQLRQFARAKRLGVFHLVGHSIGATLAASYAYASPPEIASLTLVEPLGIRVPYDSDLDKMAAKNQNPFLISSPAAYERLVKFATAKPINLPAKVLQQRADALAQDTGFYRRAWKELREGDRANLLDLLLPELQVKTLIVFGGKSRAVHPSTAKVVETTMVGKDVSTQVLAGCGHWPMLEDPDALVEILLTCFRGRQSRTAVG